MSTYFVNFSLGEFIRTSKLTNADVERIKLYIFNTFKWNETKHNIYISNIEHDSINNDVEGLMDLSNDFNWKQDKPAVQSLDWNSKQYISEDIKNVVNKNTLKINSLELRVKSLEKEKKTLITEIF
jgi:hypothetical protein